MSEIKREDSHLIRKDKSLSLAFLSISQFVLLMVAISGVTAWLSWRSEEQTITSLVGQLENEIGDRIEQKLTSYLETPHLINQINADAVRRGKLKVQDRASERYLWQQIQHFPSVSWIYYGAEAKGEFVGVTRLERYVAPQQEDAVPSLHSGTPASVAAPTLQIVINDATSNYKSHYHSSDREGNRRQLIRKDSKIYDARKRPWYKTALQVGSASWSQIYPAFSTPNLIVSANLSVSDPSGKQLGVLGVDFNLEDINRFLNSLAVGKSGETFIVEHSGLLIGSSTSETPYVPNSDVAKIKRLSATESQEPLIRYAAKYLTQKFGKFDRINTPQQLEFEIDGKRQFLKVKPFHDDRGLDWLIVVVVPESDFTAQLASNRQTTIWLCLLALTGAIAIGIFTTHYISKPIRQLIAATKSIANGELDRLLPAVGIKELNLLSQAFNQMTAQLRDSHAQLEQRVAERTAALQKSEEIFAKAFRASPQGVSISSRVSQRVIEVNESYLEYSGYLAEEIVGKQVLELPTWLSLEDPYRLTQLLNEHGFIKNLELDYRKKSGQIGTILLSAEIIELNGETCVLIVNNEITDRKQVEVALKQSEEQFRTLVANMPGIVYRCACDSEWTMEFIGGAVTEVTGYPADEFMRNRVRSWASIIHPEDVEMVDRIVNEGVALKQPYTIEYRIFNAQNQIRYLYEQGQGVFAEDGSLLWLDGAIFDLSDRKQIETDLLERVHVSILTADIGRALAQTATIPEMLQSCAEALWRHANVALARIWTLDEAGEVLELQASAGIYTHIDGARSQIRVSESTIGAIAQSRQPHLTNDVPHDPKVHDKEWVKREGMVAFAGYPLLVGEQLVGVMAMFARHTLTDTILQEMGSVATAIALGIERKHSEAKLQAANAEMSALFAAMDEIILVGDRQGRVLKIPPTKRNTRFRPTRELQGKNIVEFLRPEQAALFLSYIEQTLETQQTLNVEYSLPVAGQPVWWEASISPIDAETVIWGARDITNRRSAEIALRQSEARFQNLATNVPGVIFDFLIRVDGSFGVEYISAACQDICEYGPEEFRQKPQIIVQLIHPDDLDTFNRSIATSNQTLQPLVHEWRIVTPSGKLKWVRSNSRPEKRENGDIIRHGIITDISDRKEVEQELKAAKQTAEAASQTKSQFLANMSHELRTPLNAILGFAQLMVRDSSLQQTHLDRIKIIKNSGEYLLELINEVLDMAKIEAGRISLNEVSFDLHHLLDSLQEMFQLKAQDQKLELICERSPAVPAYISTDEGKLRQILINLLGNAIKFTPSGTVSLSVTADRFKGDRIGLAFAVADTGIGIPPTELEKIFEAFEQSETGRLSSQGTGLGLSISRKFAQMMGGSITVDSKLGEGSVFQLNLLVDVPEAKAQLTISRDRHIIGLAPNQPEYRLLVVEDKWESRVLLVNLLESIGFQVREAENGAEAIAIWEEWEPHLIWMDMRMPVMDGYAATQQIKSHIKGQATAIIALTASALESDKAIILSAGCDDFVRKPFRESVLLEKVAEHLGVCYLYKEEIEENKPEERSDIPLSDTGIKLYLSEMPDTWVAQLYQAATLADNDLISELVAAIPANNLPLTQALTNLVDSFAYDRIMFLTKDI
jgi:PAS domain S-box-containing protein